MMEKDGDIISTFLPPDGNCMLVTMEEIFKSRNSLNIVVASKKMIFDWLTLEEARVQMDRGIMTWDFASDEDPQVVLVGSGDYVTNECLAAIQMFKEFLPDARVRFVNVSELTSLGVGDETVKSNSELLDEYLTKDKGVVFNFHGYPHTIKKLLFDYSGAHRIKVKGYREEGSTTSPFDMKTRNRTSRYHLILDMAEVLLRQKDISREDFEKIEYLITDRLNDHKKYIIKFGDDPNEIKHWKWKGT